MSYFTIRSKFYLIGVLVTVTVALSLSSRTQAQPPFESEPELVPKLNIQRPREVSAILVDVDVFLEGKLILRSYFPGKVGRKHNDPLARWKEFLVRHTGKTILYRATTLFDENLLEDRSEMGDWKILKTSARTPVTWKRGGGGGCRKKKIEVRVGGATLLLTKLYLKAIEHGWSLDVGRFSESEPELLITVDPLCLEFPKVDGQRERQRVQKDKEER